MGLGKERRVSSGHSNPSQSRERALSSGLRRPFPPHPVQSKLQGQSTESSASSSVGVSLFSESDVQKSKGSQRPSMSHLRSARCSKGPRHLQKHLHPWSCVTSHRETQGSERLTGLRPHS